MSINIDNELTNFIGREKITIRKMLSQTHMRGFIYGFLTALLIVVWFYI